MKDKVHAQITVTSDGVTVLFDTPVEIQEGERITLYLPKGIGERIGTVNGEITVQIESEDHGQPGAPSRNEPHE